MVAIQTQRMKMEKPLSIQVNLIIRFDKIFNLSFISASKKGYENIVAFLINNGCYISEKNKDGKTAYVISQK